MVNQTYVAQNKNGGIVDNWLAEKGHIDIGQLAGQKCTSLSAYLK